MTGVSFRQVSQQYFSPSVQQLEPTANVQKSCSGINEPSNRQQNRFNVFDFLRNMMRNNGDCNTFSGKVQRILYIFSPFMLFVNSLKALDRDGKNPGQITDQLSSAVGGIVNNKELDQLLSSELKERLDRLAKVVSTLEQKEGLSNSAMSELIRNWRESEDTKYLFQMARSIRRGNCAPFEDESLREAFIRSLESLAFALEEISKQPSNADSQCAANEIKKAAHCTVDAIECHNNKGGDKNFTQTDKEFARNKLSSASEHASNVVNNPTLSKYLGRAYSLLKSWISCINNFIKAWQEEEKERAETKRKKLCRGRKEKEKLLFEICRVKHIKQKRADTFYSLMKHAQRKIDEINLSQGGHKYCYAEKKLNEHKANYDFANTKRRCEAMSVQFYEAKAEEIVQSLPPSYICDSGLYLGLNLIC